MSALVLVYAAGLSLVARNLGTAFAQSLRLQLEKDGLLRSRDRLLASLEQRVQERTAELQSSNAQLTVEIAERRRAGEAERRARGEAERANAAKSKFLATASHDLRQPFQAMRLFHHILLSRLSDASMREIATRLGEAMQAGEELLNALLDISTLEAGTVEPRLTDFPIQPTLTRLAQEFEAQASAKGLDFRMSARLGLVTYAEEGAPPTGYDKAAMSDSTTTLINDEVRLILERSYARAKTVLTERSHSLHALAVALLEYETLDADAIRAIVDMPPPPRSNPAGTRPFAP